VPRLMVLKKTWPRIIYVFRLQAGALPNQFSEMETKD
jgi:hypothetical protein